MKTGRVYLVGAGPGDPGLLTLKAKACLEQADIVIYDYLANERLLEYVRPDAERVYVGKKAGQHTMKQEQINHLLVESARKYAVVVRLKGGDPFVFGRGGEETLELHQDGIPFEIVPGIPAGIAATAYAGIPVTHREIAASAAFVTGHEAKKADDSASVNWKIIGQSCDTLVIYMGVKNLPNIVAHLLESGKTPDTPVALVRNGTYPSQFTITGTLDNIVQQAEESQITPPALIIIGEVVTLREQLAWFETRPLFGKTVVVTRNKSSEGKLTTLLEQQGAEVYHFPTIEIVKIAPNPQLEDALRKLSSYDWLMFTSGNGVDIFFDALFRAGHDIRSLHGLKIAAIGKPSGKKLETYHLKADLIPSVFTSEQLVDEMTATGSLAGQRVLFPGSNISNPEIPKRLREDGAGVDVISIYETRQAQHEEAQIEEFKTRILAGKIDCLTFTSSSTVDNVVNIVGHDFLVQHKGTFKIASIGPVTTNTLTEYELPPDIEAEEHSFEGLVNSICS